MGVAEYPVSLGSYQYKLVYSPHDYGPSVWDQVWFDPSVFNRSNMKMVWDHYWFYIHENNTAPLFIGEWGGKMDNPDNVTWMGYLRDLIVEHGIHHTFWCLNENSGDTGGLITGGTWDGVDWEKYNFIEPAIWKDSSGRYIGLDHEVTLGTNGTNITQYYGGTTNPPATETPPVPTNVPTAPPTNPPAGMTGDVNSNGAIDIVDALLVAQYYVGLDPENFNPDKADASCNGTIDIVDALLIAQYYFGLISGFDCQGGTPVRELRRCLI
jgi:endoglucanase